jgi:tetratricopeptide (TPR) repeat protein
VKIASPGAVVAGGVLAGLFSVRAAIGVPAGHAFLEGQRLVASGDYTSAIPLLDRGAVGAYRPEGLWLAGEARLGVWDALPAAERSGPRGQTLLSEALSCFLRGQAASPSLPWHRASIGGVFYRRERVHRDSAALEWSDLDRGSWGLVGDDGRIAIGLARLAIALHPNVFDYHDQLTLLLLSLGLVDDATRAIEGAARVLPDFGAHSSWNFDTLPRELSEAFWRTSRALRAQDAPLMLPERHLLSLGLLGRRLGHLPEAEADLREALRTPGTDLFHAEDAFHLGQVLVDQKRFKEAEAMLAAASRQPVFGPGVAETRARMAEAEGRLGDALAQLRVARQLRPRDLGVLLEFARVAGRNGDWDAALEALRWARVVHPRTPATERAMAELCLLKGDHELARAAIDNLAGLVGDNDEVDGLRRRLRSPLDRSQP